MIEGLIEKARAKRHVEVRKSNYSSDALAGLAVKILAQRYTLDTIVRHRQGFEKKAVELYRIFQSARQACLA